MGIEDDVVRPLQWKAVATFIEGANRACVDVDLLDAACGVALGTARRAQIAAIVLVPGKAAVVAIAPFLYFRVS
jgi:hypothetical protein